MIKHFSGSLAFTAFGLLLAALVGWESSGSLDGTLECVFIVAVLSVLEVSLSFDNAVVNATVLQEMDEVWRRRFLTWGIAIAVFGMRIVFPLVVVVAVGRISPWEAVIMAATNPAEYARHLTEAHISVSAFGGAFLVMVGLKHFLDADKEVHWLEFIERPLTRLGRIEAVQLGLVLLLLWGISNLVGVHERLEFLVAGIFGLLTYITVDGVGALLGDASDEVHEVRARTGLSAFLYLEVLDASFSFDGVIGAFALSTNLLIIAIGLGIGAVFVRSLTILLVERGTLTEYRYLEHGAFYAILALGFIMFLQAFLEIPEVVTGLIGGVLIGWSFVSSLRYNRREGRG